MTQCVYDSTGETVSVAAASWILLAPGGSVETADTTYTMNLARGRITGITVDAVSAKPLLVYVIDPGIDTASEALTLGADATGIVNVWGGAVSDDESALPAEVYDSGAWVAGVKVLAIDRGNSQDGAGLAISASTYIPLDVFCPGGMLIAIQNVHATDAFEDDIRVTVAFDSSIY